MDLLSSTAMDVSACLLVEASGDSDQKDHLDHFTELKDHNNAEEGMEDDDAESCVDDGSIKSADDEHTTDDYSNGGPEDDEDRYEELGDDESGCESDDGVVVDKNWALKEKKRKRNAVAELSEDEKNRLFWDTCLAFGYPP